MADQEHLDILEQGVETWNQWRKEHTDIRPDLSDANLSGANLRGADLSGADLSEADFRGANLIDADLSDTNLSNAYISNAYISNAYISGAYLKSADLRGADLSSADLSSADLSDADLSSADLSDADLSDADLSDADLRGADLTRAVLVGTNLTRTTLTQCSIYGISVWDVHLEEAKQDGLIITRDTKPTITVDNLKVAQFIYLLLNNAEIRQTIDTITSQVVLILGRFPPERKEVIEALSNGLRSQKYSPVVFNFEGAENKDFTATVRTLANLAHFVLLDGTDANDAIHEIANEIVPHCVVPIQPFLLQRSYKEEYELRREFQYKHRWVLTPHHYKNLPDLQTNFQEKILRPIDERIIELEQKRPHKMFLGYSPKDKNMLDKLKPHLQSLQGEGLIKVWDDQELHPGEEKEKEIARHLSEARIILLLISTNFLGSPQMDMALERYKQGEVWVIPILLRPCDWQSIPLLKDLQVLPRDGKAISQYKDKDEVFFKVSEAIKQMIKRLG